MDYAEVKRGLTEVFREIFDNPHLTIEPDMTAHDVDGWDSTRMVELIMASESHFAIRFTTRETDSLECVDDFIHLIERKLQR